MKTTQCIYTLRQLRKRAHDEGEERDVAALDAAISAMDTEHAAGKLGQSIKRIAIPVRREKYAARNGLGARRASVPV